MRTRISHNLLLAGAATAAIVASHAQAQEAPVGESAGAEIVVTAQKRDERLIDVPVPVTAVSSDALIKQNLVKLTDYGTRIPGLSVAGSQLRQISLRGINTGGATAPTVAVTIDDVPIGSATRAASVFPDLDPAELSRIEVLRGPQGTLYGAASLGGLIKLVTANPDPDDFSGRIELGGNTVSNGGEGWYLRGSVNVPIVADRVAVRVSGFHREDAPFIDNINPLVNKKDANDFETEGGRIAVMLKPVDDLTINLSYLRQDTNSVNGGRTRVSPFPTDFRPVFGYFVNNEGPSSQETNLRLYQARIEYDLGPATLTSVSGWSEFDNFSDSDLTTTFPFVFGAVAGGPIIPGAPAGSSVRLKDGTSLNKFSQELRLGSNGSGAFQWLAGVFYTKENAVTEQNLQAFDPSNALLSEIVRFPLPGTFEEKAVFADVTYRFSDKFDLQIGGRYSKNRQTFQQNQVVLTNPVANALFGVTQNGVVQTSEDDAFTWLVTPRYNVSDDFMVYARVASGYRPGGPNNAVPGAPATFGSDTVVNYELGAKGYLFDRKVTLDMSLFNIDWEDIQLQNTSAANIAFLTNGAAARSRGIEAAVEVSPGAGFLISANATYTDAELTEDLPGPAVPGGAALIGTKGTDLPYVAKFSSNLGIEKRFDFGNDFELTLGANWSHVGKRNSQLRSTTAPPARRDALTMPAYDIIDLRAGLSKGPWELAFYVRNLGSERGVQYVDDRQGAVTTTNVNFINPQTIGASLAWKF